MKNLLIIFVLMVGACSTPATDAGTKDSINAIEDHPLEDTAVGPNPDGYAPPNAEIDTSQYRKDSIKARDSADRANK